METSRMKRTSIFALALAALLSTTAATVSAQTADPKTRLQTAEKMFAERCKKAGEFIHRTAENVEGVFLMKLRPEGMNFGDQYRMDDPYGRDLGGDAYIKSFLAGFFEANARRPDVPKPDAPPHVAYRYVEALDPKDGKRYRYTGRIKEVTKTSSPLIGGDGRAFTVKEFGLDRVPAPGPMPRYGVTYDDISTREERDYWIAGSSLKVIDLQTNEVMAERIGYMMDRGQGSDSGGRAPWLLAANNACPSFKPREGQQPGFSYQVGQTRKFVKKILKPVLERK
jgi:hypothetical protein